MVDNWLDLTGSSCRNHLISHQLLTICHAFVTAHGIWILKNKSGSILYFSYLPQMKKTKTNQVLVHVFDTYLPI